MYPSTYVKEISEVKLQNAAHAYMSEEMKKNMFCVNKQIILPFKTYMIYIKTCYKYGFYILCITGNYSWQFFGAGTSFCFRMMIFGMHGSKQCIYASHRHNYLEDWRKYNGYSHLHWIIDFPKSLLCRWLFSCIFPYSIFTLKTFWE